MALLVPIALDNNGDTVLPVCDKDQGPFKCIECSERLVVPQGENNDGILIMLPLVLPVVPGAGNR